MKFIVRLTILAIILLGVFSASIVALASDPFQGLRLTGMYACDNSRAFRVRNSNAFDVPYTWRSTATGETGSATAPPGDHLLTIDGGNTTFIIRWDYNGNSGSQTKSSNNSQNCPEPPVTNQPVAAAVVNAPALPVYVPPVFDDGRCNPDPWASVVLYRGDGGFDMYGVFDTIESDGYFLFSVSDEDIASYGLPDEAVVLAQSNNLYGGLVALWLLPSGELQIHAAALPSHTHDWYDYVFDECR